MTEQYVYPVNVYGVKCPGPSGLTFHDFNQTHAIPGFTCRRCLISVDRSGLILLNPMAEFAELERAQAPAKVRQVGGPYDD